MSRAVTEQIVKGILQWENLQEVQKSEPLGCKVSTFVRFEIGSVDTIGTLRLWRFEIGSVDTIGTLRLWTTVGCDGWECVTQQKYQ